MDTKLNKILAEISAGELIDKITILEIKKTKITDVNKLNEINKELKSLESTFDQHIDSNKIKDLSKKLKEINLALWEIENGKRLAEKNNEFGIAKKMKINFVK